MCSRSTGASVSFKQKLKQWLNTISTSVSHLSVLSALLTAHYIRTATWHCGAHPIYAKICKGARETPAICAAGEAGLPWEQICGAWWRVVTLVMVRTSHDQLSPAYHHQHRQHLRGLYSDPSFIGLILCLYCLPHAPRFNSRNNKKYFLSDTIT